MSLPNFCNIPNPSVPYPQWARTLNESVQEIDGSYSTFRVVPSTINPVDFFDQFPEGSTDPHPAMVIRHDNVLDPELWYYDGAAWVEISPYPAFGTNVAIAAYKNVVQYPLIYGERARISWENVVFASPNPEYAGFDGSTFLALIDGVYRFSIGYTLRISGSNVVQSGGNSLLFNEVNLYRNPTNFDHRENINLVTPHYSYGGANMFLLQNIGIPDPVNYNICLPEDELPDLSSLVRSVGMTAVGITHLNAFDRVEAYVRSGLQQVSGSPLWGIGGGSSLRRHEYFIVEHLA